MTNPEDYPYQTNIPNIDQYDSGLRQRIEEIYDYRNLIVCAVPASTFDFSKEGYQKIHILIELANRELNSARAENRSPKVVILATSSPRYFKATDLWNTQFPYPGYQMIEQTYLGDIIDIGLNYWYPEAQVDIVNQILDDLCSGDDVDLIRIRIDVFRSDPQKMNELSQLLGGRTTIENLEKRFFDLISDLGLANIKVILLRPGDYSKGDPLAVRLVENHYAVAINDPEPKINEFVSDVVHNHFGIEGEVEVDDISPEDIAEHPERIPRFFPPNSIRLIVNVCSTYKSDMFDKLSNKPGYEQVRGRSTLYALSFCLQKFFPEMKIYVGCLPKGENDMNVENFNKIFRSTEFYQLLDTDPKIDDFLSSRETTLVVYNG